LYNLESYSTSAFKRKAGLYKFELKVI